MQIRKGNVLYSKAKNQTLKIKTLVEHGRAEQIIRKNSSDEVMKMK